VEAVCYSSHNHNHNNLKTANNHNHKPQTTTTMMFTFTLSPISFLCLMLAIISNTMMVVNAAVATSMTTAKMTNTAAVSVSSVRPASVTMMAMTAGSRTLIEIGNNCNHDDDESSNNQEFIIDITYLDEDYENGLLILRRANVVNEKKKKKKKNEITSNVNPSSSMQKILTAIKNPIVASILIGNIASMIGLIPLGLSGFLPAISIAIGMKLKNTKMKWLSRPLAVLAKTIKRNFQ
jgi:hypothetical protein